MPFFTPVAGVSLGGQSGHPEVSAESTSGTIQPAASTIARGQRQISAAESSGDRGDRSDSPGTPPSRRPALPFARGRATPRQRLVPRRRRHDRTMCWCDDGSMRPRPRSSPRRRRRISRSAARRRRWCSAPATPRFAKVSRRPDSVTEATETPAPTANAEPSMTLAHHVQRAPIVRTGATTDQSMPAAGPLPLHSVNTGRITAAIAQQCRRACGTSWDGARDDRAGHERGRSRLVTSGPRRHHLPPAVSEQTGGGGSLSPDRMMSHMLRQIAIERERRGGGRWPLAKTGSCALRRCRPQVEGDRRPLQSHLVQVSKDTVWKPPDPPTDESVVEKVARCRGG